MMGIQLATDINVNVAQTYVFHKLLSKTNVVFMLHLINNNRYIIQLNICLSP
jgi:hypothetical protein